MTLATHPEYLLSSQNAFHKDGPQLVPDSRQQEAKQRDTKYGIQDTEDLPTLRAGSYISITWEGGREGKEEEEGIGGLGGDREEQEK